jgi:hypothetical protein
MADLGKTLVGLGLLLVVIGALVVVLGRFQIPLGRLPGDITYRGKNTTYFPIVTCIVLSALLSLVLWVINHLKR